MNQFLPIVEAPARRPAATAARLSLIDDYLREHRAPPSSATAVDRFSRHHTEHGQEPAQAKYYRDLIPVHAPRPGQQYAFEVDMDACSGCKSCVTACHSLNGLDEHESWRSVGLLIGGSSDRPVMQHVTTAC